MKRDERAEALEVLQGMTKEEIIAWLSNDIAMLFRPPSKSHLLFGRYQAASDAVMKRREENRLSEGLSGKIDGYTAEINRTNDTKECLAIFEKMKPYRKKWDKRIAESKAIRAEEAKVEKLWEAYLAQSDLESGKRRAGAGPEIMGGAE